MHIKGKTSLLHWRQHYIGLVLKLWYIGRGGEAECSYLKAVAWSINISSCNVAICVFKSVIMSLGCLNKQVLSELKIIDSRPICYTVGSFKDKVGYHLFYHSTYTVKCCMDFGLSLLKVGLLLCHTETPFSVPSNGVKTFFHLCYFSVVMVWLKNETKRSCMVN